MKRATLVLLVVLALAVSAAAQNKFSGAAQCGKLDKDYKIEVGDRPGHAFEIIQGKCTYTKGEIAEIQVKEEMFTNFYEVSRDTARCRGLSVMTMANGDKAYSRYDCTMALKGGTPQTEDGKYSYSGGIGKFKGLKGKGTYKSNIATDGTSTVEIEGEYELAK